MCEFCPASGGECGVCRVLNPGIQLHKRPDMGCTVATIDGGRATILPGNVVNSDDAQWVYLVASDVARDRVN